MGGGIGGGEAVLGGAVLGGTTVVPFPYHIPYHLFPYLVNQLCPCPVTDPLY